jgi:type I restriction enzyme M protein
MRFDEFAGCRTWWNKRKENERAWRVPIAEIESSGFNLDMRNPHGPEDLAHRPPEELLEELLANEHEILGLLKGLKTEIGTQ